VKVISGMGQVRQECAPASWEIHAKMASRPASRGWRQGTGRQVHWEAVHWEVAGNNVGKAEGLENCTENLNN
jgi:hypothetical protein